MKPTQEPLDLKKAFPPMPQDCKDALMQAAHSVQEAEKPVHRAPFRTALIAALVLALLAVGAFAAQQLGWVRFLNEGYNVTVPQAAQELLSAAEPQCYEVGPATFSFTELLADPHTAFSSASVQLTDGSAALFAMDPWETVADRIPAFAAKHQLFEDATWLDAAKQLDLPLYMPRALLDISAPYATGNAMEDVLQEDAGRLIYLNMVELVPDAVEAALPAPLYLSLSRIDPETGDEVESWTVQEELTLSVTPRMAEKEYHPQGNAMLGELTITNVHAELYVTGAYVTIRGSFPENFHSEDMEALDTASDLLYTLHCYDASGALIQDGMNLSGTVQLEQLPQCSLTFMLSMDALPDTLLLSSTSDAALPNNAPRITLQ